MKFWKKILLLSVRSIAVVAAYMTCDMKAKKCVFGEEENLKTVKLTPTPSGTHGYKVPISYGTFPRGNVPMPADNIAMLNPSISSSKYNVYLAEEIK